MALRARVMRSIALAVAGVGIVALVSAALNPAFTAFPVAFVRTEGIASTGAFARFLFLYLDPAVRQLEFDPASGVASLRSAESACADDPVSFDCGRVAWHAGDFRLAVSRFEALVRQDGGSERALFWLGLSQMRLAEAENCLDPLVSAQAQASLAALPSQTHVHAHGDEPVCALPIRVFHANEQLTLQAAASFERLIDRYGDRPLYRWLANFAYMPANDFPDGVPEHLRLPERNAFRDLFYGARGARQAEAYAHIALRDIAPAAGVDWSRLDGRPNSGRGAAVADFDGDGCLDIVTGGVFGTVSLYVNSCVADAPLRFVDRSVASGLAAFKSAHIITAADYDDDGHVDVFVARHYGSLRGDFKLLRNRGDATFEDVTQETGLVASDDRRFFQTWGSAWGDVDADGDLDLFVANWVMHNANMKDGFGHIWRSSRNAPSMLFRNDGGRFVDVTQEFGLSELERHNVIGVAFGDYDQDGFVDLAATLLYSPGVRLFKNAGGRGFSRVPLDAPGIGFMTAFVDVDQDGRLDLFAGGMGAAETATERVVFGTGDAHTGSRVFLQVEDGRFTRSEDYFVDELPAPTMGASFGDLDHDGSVDWYLGTGNPEGALVVPNLLYVGRQRTAGEPARADNVSMLAGVGTIQKGHGIVFADFDRDGDQDIYSVLGGFWPGDRWPDQLFLNDTTRRGRFVEIELVGCESNGYGLGASIEVVVRDPEGRVRSSHYLMDNKTGFGSAPYVANMGLGDAVAIERIFVRWIGPSGLRREYAGVPLDTRALLAESGAIVDSRNARAGACVSRSRLDELRRGRVRHDGTREEEP